MLYHISSQNSSLPKHICRAYPDIITAFSLGIEDGEEYPDTLIFESENADCVIKLMDITHLPVTVYKNSDAEYDYGLVICDN